MDPFSSFHSLSPEFVQEYFRWHSTGQYEGVPEFSRWEEARDRPPNRERDDWYGEELRVIDQYHRPLAGSDVLEIGCGDGNLTWKLATRCRSLVACDVDPGAVALTARRLAELGLSNVSLRREEAGSLTRDTTGTFDVVFFVQVLEHVPNWKQAPLFDTVFSLVRPGGSLFISTPNRWSLRDAHDTGKFFIHWLPRPLRVGLAKSMGWGLKGHDPAWPYPPVLHDYVSFRWMLRRARRAWPPVVASEMSFYPSVDHWLLCKGGGGTAKQAARRVLAQVGRALPLNYYFGDKAIFRKATNSRVAPSES